MKEKLVSEFGCDCLNDLLRRLEDRFGPESEPLLDVRSGINFTTAKTFDSIGTLTARYWGRKKDGSRSSKRKKTEIWYSHCPFCGKDRSKEGT